MANQEVDRLIQELSQILEQNRQKRQQQDAMVLGAKQEQQRTAAQDPSLRTPILQRSTDQSKLAHASQFDDTGYDRHKNKMFRGDENDGLGPLSPNYRSKLSEQYNMLKENDTAAPPPTDAGALEEQKKRFTQNLMMQRGQSGGPLGGAGAPPELNTPTTAGMDPTVTDAVARSGGPVQQMNLGGPAPPSAGTQMPTTAQPPGFLNPGAQPPNTDALDAYLAFQQQRGGL